MIKRAFQRASAGEPLQTAQVRYVGLPCEGEERKTTNGFVSGVYAGAGFLLLKRRVLELMAAKYPETQYTAAHNTPEPNPSPNLFALFDCLIDPKTGHYLSEDYAFCSRWGALGGTVWLDLRGLFLSLRGDRFGAAPPQSPSNGRASLGRPRVGED